MLKTSVVILFSAVLLGTVAAFCPPEMITRPCTCEQKDGNFYRCENIRNKKDLQAVFLRNSMAMNGLELVNSNIESLPPLPLLLRSIGIINSNLTTIMDRKTSVMNNVLVINLKNVNFEKSFPWEDFKNLKRLAGLVAIDVKISSLDYGFKDNVTPNLKYMALSNTSTERMDDGVCSMHKQLEDVRIEYNLLKTYHRNAFPNPFNVINLSFRGNKLENLTEDAFSNMKRLQNLDLSNNNLTTIPDIFSKIGHSLSNLDLSGNLMTCDKSFAPLISNPPKYEFKGKCETPEKLKDKSLKDLSCQDIGSCR